VPLRSGGLDDVLPGGEGVVQPQKKQEVIYSVFVSSTSRDLEKYRKRARDLILTNGSRPLAMEYFPAESTATQHVLQRYLGVADAVILIAGARYGSLVDGRSFVEWELEAALSRGIPVVALVMSDRERRRKQPVDPQERTRQEQFIQLLRQRSKVAEFENSTFDGVLAGALRMLPSQVSKDAGLIRVTDSSRIRESMSARLRSMDAQDRALRMLSGVALMSRHSERQDESETPTMRNSDERQAMERLLDLIYQDMASRPVQAQMINRLIRQLVGRLEGFTAPQGFVPQSSIELETCIDELFGGSLTTLKATSIHSNHDALKNYKGYWEDRDLGDFFKRKNKAFLSRDDNRTLLRVFACDSVAECVAEEWFTSTAVQQVKDGAHVKVVEINPARVIQYEDFGVYEHEDGESAPGGYVLLAPRDSNLHSRGLTTSVIVDSHVVSDFLTKFEALWDQSPEPLALLDAALFDEASRRPLDHHGSVRITDLFGGRIILRRMKRLDTGEVLLGASTGYVRKYQPAYAAAVSKHLRRTLPDVNRLIYVGDTYKNDGTAIRNLQSLGWDVKGFICEPALGLSRLWLNDVMYTNQWSDLAGFADHIQSDVGPRTQALFDIDQTLWAPKGVHDKPLAKSRTRAMAKLVDDYVADESSDVAMRAKARIEELYSEISQVKYLPLTLDNEDFKATICVFLALNVVFDEYRLESGGREGGAAFFGEIGQLDVVDFVNFVRSNYLPAYLHHEQGGEASITRFIMETQATAQLHQYSLYGETNGVLVARVVEHLRDILRETVGTSSIQYAAFRAKELEETLIRVSDEEGFEGRLVLNKPAWDFAIWLHGRRVHLLALSDRPDEATLSGSGESLLDSTMTLYGKDISGLLPGVDDGATTRS